MSKMRNIFWSLVVVAAGLCLTAADQPGTIDKYLTPADIQGVTGFTGVKMSQSSQKGVTGNMHFVNKDGKPILIAKFLKSAIYKKSEAAKMGLVKGNVNGIGEDAYYGPNVDTPYILTFRKGAYCVELSTIFDQKVKLFLSMEQLQALGKIIAPRI